MNYWVGVTDNKWYRFLSAIQPDEVNFWQPSAKPPFTNAPIGLPFFFKLKRPNNHIAGGGFYVTYSKLPLSLAWEVFGPKNGCSSLKELRQLIDPLVSGPIRESEIGCTVLANPFFLDEKDWIEDPPGWAPNIVRGKMYASDTLDGRRLWNVLQPYLPFEESGLAITAETDLVHEPGAKYGPPIAAYPRLGQSSFRVLVTEAYQRRCAITGENTLLALEAAHIVPYAGDGDHDIRNGMLLRADFHRLFDVGLVGITPELRVKISPRIREAWLNGKVYYRLHDKPLTIVPTHPEFRPDPDRLEWHFKNRFQA